MAEACGHVLSQMTPNGAKLVGVALSEIRSQNPTPEIIWEKATLYKEIHPTWELTPKALAKYWSELQPGRERRTAQSVKQDQLDRDTEEILEASKANASQATSNTPTSTTTDEQKPPEAPRPNATSRNDGFSHKTRNRTSDGPTEAKAPKTDGSNNVSGSINTTDHHRGAEAPRPNVTLESEGILPSSNHVALEQPTAPLTESLHDPASGFTNTGSQVQQWEDALNDDDYQKWLASQFWEENEPTADDYAF